jgi:hypothetical protein
MAVCLIFVAAQAFAQGGEPDPGHYDDKFTFKKGKPFYLDPYVWSYSKDFAARFRMPERWIDPGLQGALALAWRMTTIGPIMCGLGGKESNCWPPLACQLDVYYDSAIELPWNYPEVIRDNLMPGLTSAEFIHDLSDSKRMRRYVDKNDRNRPRAPMSSGGTIEYGDKFQFRNGFANVVFFDRDYEPGIGVLSRVGSGVCPPSVPGPGRMQFFAATKRVVHTIQLPESYLARVRVAYEAQNKPNEDVTRNLIRQFFEKR